MNWDYKLDNVDMEATPDFIICTECEGAVWDDENDPKDYGWGVCECEND